MISVEEEEGAEKTVIKERVAIRALFVTSAFVLASTVVEGCCITKFKPVTKHTHQLIYILFYMIMRL